MRSARGVCDRGTTPRDPRAGTGSSDRAGNRVGLGNSESGQARGALTTVMVTADSTRSSPRKGCRMLWTIFVILLVLWALGIVSSYTLGGFIHLLLVLAVVVLLIRVIQGRPV